MKAKHMARKARRAIGFLTALLFAAAGFAGLRALAQAPAAGIPAAPPGGINAAKLPDTNGVHLGMSQDEALAAMKKLYPGDLLTIRNARFDNGQVWVAQLEARSAETCNNQCYDVMAVVLSTPPNPIQVVSIQRTMQMAPGKQPTMDTTVASLRQKYGKELASAKVGMAWAYDEQGRPINPQGPSNWDPADCAPQRTGVVGGQAGSPLAVDAPVMGPIPLADILTNLNRNQCSRNVYVTVRLTPTTIQGAPVVVRIDMFLGEQSLMFRDAIAQQQYFEAKRQKQQLQQQKNAQQRKAPTL